MLKLLIICATISTISANSEHNILERSYYCQGSRNLTAIMKKFVKFAPRPKEVEMVGHQFQLFLENTAIMHHNLEVVSKGVCENKGDDSKIDAFLAEYKKIADMLMVASYDTFMRFETIRQLLNTELYDNFFIHKLIMDSHLEKTPTIHKSSRNMA